MTELKQKTGYSFVYEGTDLNTKKRVTVNAQSLDEAVSQMLQGQDATYEIQGKSIIVHHQVPASMPAQKKEGVQQQKTTIKATGKVVDEKGEPIIGATVMEKGTKNGTVTDLNGYYSLEVPVGSSIDISYIGFKSRQIKAGGNTTIILSEDTKSLDELVVVGYGTMKKSDLTGSMSVIKGEDIADRGAHNLSLALQGATSGVQVTRDNGDPSAAGTINIRGITTISDSSPLVIVDGVPGTLDLVNSDDVASISVLKDAASASIYGARAASGVIVITTKRGTNGKLNLKYNFEYGWEIPTETPEYVNAQRYIEMDNETRYNDNPSGGWFQNYTEDEVNNWMTYNKTDPDHYPNSNWEDAIIKSSASRSSHSITATAGNKVLSTNASFHYDDVGGLWVNKDFNRYMFRINNDININKYLAAHVDVNFKHSKEVSPTVNPLSANGRKMPPIYAIKYSDGRWGDAKDGGNVLAIMNDGGTNTLEYNRLGSKAGLDFSPFSGLKLSGVVSVNYAFNQGKNFLKAMTYTYVDQPDNIRQVPGYVTTQLTESRTNIYDITYQLFANYDKKFGLHSVSGMAGYESYYTKSNVITASRDHFELSEFPYLDLGSADYQYNTGNGNHSAYRSFFGRLAYDYDNRYLMQFNIRRDGSSRFAKNYRWGNFPSFSIGWVATEEKFMEKLKNGWLNNLKIRASWGQLGNERIGSTFPYQSLIKFGNSLLYNGNIVTSYTSASQWDYAVNNITWETTETWDLGLDFSMLNNRLYGSFDSYKKRTKGMLLALEIPDYIGLNDPDVNAGEMHTNGWDFEIGWRDRIGKFHYSFSANISDYISKMGNLNGTEFLGTQIIRQGSQYDEWYGYLSDGLYLTQEDVDNSAKLNDNVQVGDIKYKDISGPNGVPDGKITPEYDRVLLGGSLPRYLFGLKLDGDYKGFDLSFTFQGVGKQIARLTPTMVEGLENNFCNFPKFIDGNYWSTKNTDEQNARVFYPRLTYKNAHNDYVMSDYWLFNGKYLRMKNFTFGYTLPSAITKHIFNSLRVYFSADDLFCLSKYPKGWDPEVSTTGYPITTSIIFGVSINF
jgi:TonB-linked SusC/RagA family outer membrane protein